MANPVGHLIARLDTGTLTTAFRYNGFEFSLSDPTPQIQILDDHVLLIHRTPQRA